MKQYELIRATIHPLSDCGICQYLTNRQLADWSSDKGGATNPEHVERCRAWHKDQGQGR